MTTDIASAHQANEVPVVHYEKPVVTTNKKAVKIGRASHGQMEIQVLSEGGENNLHSHPSADGYWYVLKGGVRFYTTNNEVVDELYEGDAFFTPHGYKYWFESIPGKDDLELLHFAATTRPLSEIARGRVNHEEIKENQVSLMTRKDEVPFELLDSKNS